MKKYMNYNYFNKRLIIIIPLAGIIITGIFLISYGITDINNSVKLFLHGITMTAGLWLGCMLLVMYLWKRFPWEVAPKQHLFIEIILILSYTLAFSYLLYVLQKKYWNLPKVENLGLEIFVTILITLLVTAIHESVFFYRQWKYNFSKSVKLEKDNLEAKYEVLRAQINPHFLFNSLNSLTSIVEENKAAVDYIQKLSDLLRYMLKSGEKELVLVRDEISIINSYIGLQLMRFDSSLRIKVDVAESYYHYALPPLVLQMLLENCLKHNIVSSEKPLSVEIIAEKESISVINNLQKKSDVISTGQGLNNIRGRYRFFTGRNIEISDSNGYFRVTIPLLQVEL
jgi:sensor histidine kinase YesM